jgi:deoxyhypusine synthase
MTTKTTDQKVSDTVRDAVLTASTTSNNSSSEYEKEKVSGYDWDSAVQNGQADIDSLMRSYRNTGFQATAVGKAIEEINKMVRATDHTLEPLKIILIIILYFL